MPIGPRQPRSERGAPAVERQLPLGARLAAIRWVWADGSAPFFAGMLALARHARDQSSAPISPSWSRSMRWRRCQTPALVQSHSRRQQVIPTPQPNSCGNIRHQRGED